MSEWLVEYRYSGRGTITVQAENKAEAEDRVGEMDILKLPDVRFDWDCQAFEVK